MTTPSIFVFELKCDKENALLATIKGSSIIQLWTPTATAVVVGDRLCLHIFSNIFKPDILQCSFSMGGIQANIKETKILSIEVNDSLEKPNLSDIIAFINANFFATIEFKGPGITQLLSGLTGYVPTIKIDLGSQKLVKFEYDPTQLCVWDFHIKSEVGATVIGRPVHSCNTMTLENVFAHSSVLNVCDRNVKIVGCSVNPLVSALHEDVEKTSKILVIDTDVGMNVAHKERILMEGYEQIHYRTSFVIPKNTKTFSY